jgi:hypothetical protein
MGICKFLYVLQFNKAWDDGQIDGHEFAMNEAAHPKVAIVIP